MKFILSSLFILACTFTIQAQDADLVKGNWKFADLDVGGAEVEPEKMEMAKTFFADLSLKIMDESKYEVVMMGATEVGKWELSEDGKFLTTTSDSGQVSKMEIFAIDKEKMTLAMGQAKVIMKKEE